MSLTITVTPAPEVNDVVRISAAFTDLDGVPTDPTTVTFRVKDPAGAVAVHTGDVEHDGDGEYHLDADATEAGEWFYRVEGTGAVQESGEGSFVVRTSLVI